jgi:thiol-disulfide isomerase/thioredoxin
VTNKKAAARPATKGAATPKKFPVVPVLGGIVAVALLVTILLTFGGESQATESGEPVVTGTALPVLQDNASDPAIGSPIPEVAGEDFDGNPVAITRDGRAKVIVFLAHWCPHCQYEVPILRDFVAEGLLPESVDLYSVSTGISATRENYPPSEWLEREGWNVPLVVDDTGNTVGEVFGLSAYPFWVIVGPDDTVLGRLAGRVEAADLQTLFDSVATEAAG